MIFIDTTSKTPKHFQLTPILECTALEQMSKRETKVYEIEIPTLCKNAVMLIKVGHLSWRKKKWTNSYVCKPMCTKNECMPTNQCDPWPCFLYYL